jgi:hypothetical protein
MSATAAYDPLPPPRIAIFIFSPADKSADLAENLLNRSLRNQNLYAIEYKFISIVNSSDITMSNKVSLGEPQTSPSDNGLTQIIWTHFIDDVMIAISYGGKRETGSQPLLDVYRITDD